MFYIIIADFIVHCIDTARDYQDLNNADEIHCLRSISLYFWFWCVLIWVLSSEDGCDDVVDVFFLLCRLFLSH